MQVFISHIDCLVTTLLDWTENLFFFLLYMNKANRCGATFQSNISAHRNEEMPLKVSFSKSGNERVVREEIVSSVCRKADTHPECSKGTV